MPPALRPRALYHQEANAYRLCGLNTPARTAGLLLGSGLADARARVPELLCQEADHQAEQALLESLADWCDRYTPLVGLHHLGWRKEDASLLLDISGCAHLFGGEEALLEDMQQRLLTQGFHSSVAIADTIGAAWALAHYGGGIIPRGKQAERLAPLPMALLRIAPDAVDGMAQVGLNKIGDLYGRQRAAFTRRYGQDVMQRYDQALGAVAEPLSPRRPPPAFVTERRFFDPISREDDILLVCEELSEQLATQLEKKGEGGRLFELALFRVDGAVRRVRVGTGNPVRTPALVVRLFREKLKSLHDALEAGYGYDLLRLQAMQVQACNAVQTSLNENRLQASCAVAELIDNLGARFGLDAINHMLPCDNHMPELASELAPAALVHESATFWAEATLPEAGLTRPLRLLEQPEPVEALAMVPEGPPLRFRWRKALYEVARSEGPERICPPWWCEDSGARDYFRIEDQDGRRFWLFREGVFGLENGPQPRWFLQGVFG
ncbi:Y-family DNA polymerase [Pseudovibrio hongkongensis]|uniref:Y-family DNA polymerase n=1 Tax=Polycladidibacter hongkongensis TaxID=1647556 RepID=UPI001FCAB9AE|nr:DNA polymerase Y family protein [Pseudovibrio hongkongensis]